MNFRGKGGGGYPKNFVADFSTSRKKAQHNFPKRGRGGQRPFGIFPKIHPFWWAQASLREALPKTNDFFIQGGIIDHVVAIRSNYYAPDRDLVHAQSVIEQFAE